MGDGNNRVKGKIRECEHYLINVHIYLLAGLTEIETSLFFLS